jgi:hypothetical protein
VRKINQDRCFKSRKVGEVSLKDDVTKSDFVTSNDSGTINCKSFGRRRLWLNQGSFPEFFFASDKCHENHFRTTYIQVEIPSRHLLNTNR